MATNSFFNFFPKTAYTLDDYASEQVVVDILKRVVFSKEFKENNVYIETYDVLHGETPEELSYRFYGTTELHWLILLVNDVLDPRFNWPLSEEDLVRQVESKYGGSKNVFTTNRAKNSNGSFVETFFVLLEESTHKKPQRLLFEVNDDSIPNTPIAYQDSLEISDFETNYEVEMLKNESYRSIKILKPELVQDVIESYKRLVGV